MYDAACAHCHGAIGSGDDRIATDLPRLPDDVLAAHRHYSAQDQRLVFIEKVRHGGFLGYPGRMPPFSVEALTDAQLSDMLAALGVGP